MQPPVQEPIAHHLRRSAKTSHAEHCTILVARGYCILHEEVIADMARFCPGACRAMPNLYDKGARERYASWRELSLYDFGKYDRSLCQTGNHLERHSALRCTDAEDLRRIKDRGWAIRRGMVPAHELEAMVSHVRMLGEPVRSNCGASSYHPTECTLRQDRIRALSPRFHRALTDMLEGWISTGFHDEAQLGWPLRIEHGEFISINPWKRPDVTPGCVMQSLFMASHGVVDPIRSACLVATQHDDSGSRSQTRPADIPADEWTEYQERHAAYLELRCWWDSVKRLPRERIQLLVARPDCNHSWRPRALRFLQFWRFSPQATDERPPFWDEIGVWLTTTLNGSSTFQAGQGYHSWHLDGPAAAGRHHKAWVLISKNQSTTRSSRNSSCATLSNLEPVPAAVRYAHNCQLSPSQDSWVRELPLGCQPWMVPGDVLFFREDVWHRSQDVALDRLSFIIHIYRTPLRTTPLVAIETGERG